MSLLCLTMLENMEASRVEKNPIQASTLLGAVDFYLSIPDKHFDHLHEEILTLCNQSIAFAPINSDEHANACQVRSDFLDHLNYELEEIELNDSSYSSDVLCFTPSETIAGAAECVNIDSNEKFGRHLVANRDIKREEIVIVEEAYAVLPKQEKTYLLCTQCLRVAWRAVPCDSCPLVIYCSESCKIKGWKNFHDVECAVLPHIYEDSRIWDISLSIIVLRCLVISIKEEGLATVLRDAQAVENEKDTSIDSLLSKGLLSCKNFKSLYHLTTEAEVTSERLRQMEEYSALILDLILKHTSLLNNCTELDSVKKMITKLSLIVEINHLKYQGSICLSNHNWCNINCDSIKGFFISTCSSIVNHSCTPNLGKVFTSDRKIILFAACPIKKGEQLCITYGPTVARTLNPERIGSLHCYHNLTCLCQACVEGWCPCSCSADDAGERSSDDHQKHLKYDSSSRLDDKRLALEEKLFQQYGEKYEMPHDCY